MVPTDYRLDQVTARLIERLEGARPTYATSPDGAATDFRRIAREHVERAIGEFEEVALTEHPEAQAEFLRREVMETFLPRYHRLAVEMNGATEGGFGFGRLARPLGRLGLFVIALIILWFVLLKLIYLPVVWPLILLDLSLPFWPDIAAMVHRRRYHNDLYSLVADMTRIQDQTDAYLPRERLTVADEAPPRAKNRETESN